MTTMGTNTAGACRCEASCQQAEEGGVRAGRGEVDADAVGLFDDSGADLEQAQPEGGELGAGERRLAGNGVTQGEHQPVGAGVQDQPELIGEGAATGGAVRGELPLVQLDQVLGLASGAVAIFVEMAGLTGQRGDDVAGVEAARGGLQPGDDPAFAPPGAGGVGEGGEAAHPVRAGLGTADLEVVGHLVPVDTVAGTQRQETGSGTPLGRRGGQTGSQVELNPLAL